MPRLLATLAAIIVSLPFAAHAGRPLKEIDVTFRTFDEMLQMTPKHRREYLAEMRNIVIELEQNSDAGLKAALNEGTFREWLDVFGVASANADSICNSDETYDKDTGVCYRMPLKDPLPGYNCTKIKNPNEKYNGYLVCARMPSSGAASSKDQTKLPGGGAANGTSGGVAGPANGGGDGSSKAARDKNSHGAPPDAPPASPGQKDWAIGCTPRPLVCKDRETYRSDFYGKKRACLYAGNISSYPGAVPQKGKCKPVKTSNANPALKSSCPSGQVVCNPLVFGLAKGPDGKFTQLICVPASQEATEECDKNPSAPADNVEQLFKQDFPGFRESWNKFVESLKEICSGDLASAQFHCKECNIVSRRLFKIEEKIRGEKLCSGTPSTSGNPSAPAPPSSTAPGGSAPATR